MKKQIKTMGFSVEVGSNKKLYDDLAESNPHIGLGYTKQDEWYLLLCEDEKPLAIMDAESLDGGPDAWRAGLDTYIEKLEANVRQWRGVAQRLSERPPTEWPAEAEFKRWEMEKMARKYGAFESVIGEYISKMDDTQLSVYVDERKTGFADEIPF